jgi:hypothetical protein
LHGGVIATAVWGSNPTAAIVEHIHAVDTLEQSSTSDHRPADRVLFTLNDGVATVPQGAHSDLRTLRTFFRASVSDFSLTARKTAVTLACRDR